MPVRDGLVILGLIGFALFVRTAAHGHLDMHFDEWFHVLTGLSWAKDGSFTFIQGEYTRTRLFTVMTAGAMQILPFDPTVSARVPTILFGLLAIWLFYRLTCLLTHQGIAILATLLLAIDQIVVEWSVYTRFYSLQLACILIVVYITEKAVRDGVKSRPRILLTGLAVLLAAAVASLMQITSVVPLGGYLLFRLLDWPALRAQAIQHPRVSIAISFVLLLFTLAAAVIVGPTLWEILRFADSWAIPYKDDIFFYDFALRLSYGVLWPLTPVAVLVGLRYKPYATLLSLAMIIPTLLVQSLGGMKALRYLLPIIPFFTIIWASAIWQVGAYVRDKLSAIISSFKLPWASAQLHSYIASSVVALSLAWAVIGNDNYRSSLGDTARSSLNLIRSPAQVLEPPVEDEWMQESKAIGFLITPGTFVITNEHQKVSYFITEPNARIVNRASHKDEFLWFEEKTGLLQIGLIDELKLVRQCYSKGLVILPNYSLGGGTGLNKYVPFLDVSSQRMEGFERFSIWTWDNGSTKSLAASGKCDAIPERANEILAAGR